MSGRRRSREQSSRAVWKTQRVFHAHRNGSAVPGTAHQNASRSEDARQGVRRPAPRDRLFTDAYHIIDYKTNDLSSTTTAELAEHYRPQMLAYALALLQHDESRDVRASLRFTDAGVEERFEWKARQAAEIESELRSMTKLLT